MSFPQLLVIIAGAFSVWPLFGAPVEVSALSVPSVISVGSTFSVEIRAVMPDPIVGWGLDLSWNSQFVGLTGISIGSSWFAVASQDGDGLAGVAFPDSITGPNVLLATLTFLALAEGVTWLVPGISNGDLTEGFALDPSGFADVGFTNASITIEGNANAVPEPNTFFLSAAFILVVLLRTANMMCQKALVSSDKQGSY